MRLLSRHLLLAASLVALACGGDPAAPGGLGGGAGTASGKLYFENVADGVWEYDFATKKAQSLFEGRQPHRLASGETLLFDEWFERLFVMNPQGISRTEIVKGLFSFQMGEAQGSPDGTKIAFTNDLNSYSSALAPETGTLVFDRQGNQLAFFAGKMSPTWFPDGRLLMAGSFIQPTDPLDKIHTPVQAGLYVTDAALTTTTRVDPELNDPVPLQPASSPDGKRIAFVLNEHVWMMNVDGTGLRQVTSGDKSESYPSWSPDGKWLAVSAFGTFEETYHASLAIVSSSGAAPVALDTASGVWPRIAGKEAGGGRINAASRVTWR